MGNGGQADLINPQVYYILNIVLNIFHADLLNTILQYFSVIQDSIPIPSF